MATSRERMQAYALRGVRADIEQLLEKAVELKADFPEVSSLDEVRRAITDAIAEVDEMGGERHGGEEDRPNGRRPKPSKPSKPSTTKKQPPKSSRGRIPSAALDAAAVSARKRAWEVGRETLLKMKPHPDGITIKDLAMAMGVSYGTAAWRVRKRADAGHCKVVDAATGAYAITPAGNTALAKDEGD